MKIPHVDLELLEYLEGLFPDRAPEPSDSMEQIRHKAGQASVARHLRSVYEEQVDKSLTA